MPDDMHLDDLHLDDMLLNEYLDGELAAGNLRGVEAHLETCPACKARLEALRALFQALERLPDLPLERDLTPAVLARLEPLATTPHRQSAVAAKDSLAWWPVLAWQLIVALALSGLTGWLAWPRLVAQAAFVEAGASKAVTIIQQAAMLRLSDLAGKWGVAWAQIVRAWSSLTQPTEWLLTARLLNFRLPGWDVHTWATPFQALQFSALEAALLAAAAILWVVGNGLLLNGVNSMGQRLQVILKQRSR